MNVYQCIEEVIYLPTQICQIKLMHDIILLIMCEFELPNLSKTNLKSI